MKRERGMTDIALLPLEASDRNQFILDNQEAFNYGALVEFGLQDDHFEEPDEIISRETIEKSIDGGEAYRIMQDNHTLSANCNWLGINGPQGIARAPRTQASLPRGCRPFSAENCPPDSFPGATNPRAAAPLMIPFARSIFR
jgi:hypothetical protein